MAYWHDVLNVLVGSSNNALIVLVVAGIFCSFWYVLRVPDILMFDCQVGQIRRPLVHMIIKIILFLLMAASMFVWLCRP